MFNRESQIKSRSSTGFTLVELLIVIGIIALLISILLPVVGRMRIQGQRVATQNTINRLVQACEAYNSDFNSYPGPFGEDQVAPAIAIPPLVTVNIAGTPTPFTLNFVNNGVTTVVSKAVTSSENLFVGLCGGLKFTYAGGTINGFVFDQDGAKQATGPRWLNSNQAKKSQAYMDVTPADYSGDASTLNPLQQPNGVIPASPPFNNPGMWWRTAGNTTGDSELFEFVDRFRVPQPILYMRARRGGDSFMNLDNNGGGSENSAYTTNPQYYPTQITRAYASVLNNPRYDSYRIWNYAGDSTDPTKQYWHASTLDFPAVPVDPSLPLPPTGTNVKFKEGDEHYFVNPELSTGNPVTTGVATNKLIVQHKDGFILISAGPDGIYGTADDIRN